MRELKHEFTLTEIPKLSVNQIYTKHWGVKKKNRELFYNRFFEEGIKEDVCYPCELEYVFHFKERPLDSTNCFGMAKIIEDFFVPDDSPDIVRSVICISKSTDKDMNYVEVRVYKL